VRLLLVCRSLGTGTTAVAGLLARLGASGSGPYFRPADERIPNSYELSAFRDLLQAVVSEATLTPTSGTDVKIELAKFRDRLVNQEFGPYDNNSGNLIFLKHPPAAFIIPQICEAFETRLIYVIRPLTGGF
jgi:hypothetical protein